MTYSKRIRQPKPYRYAHQDKYHFALADLEAELKSDHSPENKIKAIESIITTLRAYESAIQ